MMLRPTPRVLFLSSLVAAGLSATFALTVDETVVRIANQNAARSGLSDLVAFLHALLPRRFLGAALLAGGLTLLFARTTTLRWRALSLIFASGTANLTTAFSKATLGRIRPINSGEHFENILAYQERSGSLPSSHVSTCVAVALGILLLCDRPSLRVRLMLATSVALCMAWGRVAGAVHYPSDCLASMALVAFLYGATEWFISSQSSQTAAPFRLWAFVFVAATTPAILWCWS